MNAKHIIALTALAFAGTAAMADDITIATEHAVSTKSRAEVRAELAQARAAGQLQNNGEASYVLPQAVTSTVSRDQVRAELRQARQTQVVTYNPAA